MKVLTEDLESDWVSRFADEVIAEAQRRDPGGRIVCASGLSPSGPVHLGNLREVMTPHLVADEIRRRGLDCDHLLSWDDFDRFRKVPAGIDPSWEQYIGRPLTSVPAPPGSEYPNWAEHFKAPMTAALAELGVQVRPISQTQMYTSGAYREEVLKAMSARRDIDAVLAQYRTKKRAESESDDDDDPGPSSQGAGAANEDRYFPYRPYCTVCDKDLTEVLSYDDATTELRYHCHACGHDETVRLDTHTRGKLVWKVDWPMRWNYEGVVFEPSGVDHYTPGSSFSVGSELIRKVYGTEPPIGPMYAFVGITGMAKMSSSRGAVPTPTDALQIMEAPLLRWLYARRRPNQSFKVAFDVELTRLYDEWDATARRVAAAGGGGPDGTSFHRALNTALGPMPDTPHRVPFRTLASIVDVTAGSKEQLLRILTDLDPADPISDLSETEPRLGCATRWIEAQPAEQRTRVLDAPDAELLGQSTEQEREALRMLVEGLDAHRSLDELTTLVYGVPKIQAGLPADAKPTPELKVAQRNFFSRLYRLLGGRDTGPRLPTLLLALGPEQVRSLIRLP